MNTFVIAIVVKASLLMGAAAVVNGLLRKRTSAATRHFVWTLAMTGVLLLPLASVSVPTWSIPIHVKAAEAARPVAPAAAADEPFEEGAAPSTTVTTVDSEPPPSTKSVASGLTTSAVPPLGTLTAPELALGLYLSGVALLLLRLAFSRLTLARLVRQSSEPSDPAWRNLLRECEARMGVARPVRLLRSLERSMPMAFGVRTPTILIPAVADTWDEDRKRAVLLHELAHIVRHDCLTQLVAEVTCAAYWLHPAVWLVARRLRMERELACDDRVLAVGTAARDYAGHLLELAYSLGGHRSPALVVSMARPRQLEGRMIAVLDVARNRMTPPLRAQLIGLAAVVVLVVPLAAAETVVISDAASVPAMVVWSEPAPPADLPAPQAEALVSQDTTSTTTTTTHSHTHASTVAQAHTATTSDERAREREERERQREKEREEREQQRDADREAREQQRNREIRLPGTWEMRTADEAGKVYLQVSDRPNSQHGSTIALDQLDLPASTLANGGAARFNMKRDAGTIAFDGVFKAGVGAGTFDFTPSPTFPAEMVKRGFESPNATEQYLLARGNIGFAYLDELNSQKYRKPTLAELVRAADHGVHLEYLKGMGGAGYHLGDLPALIRTRDHGVSLDYIKALSDEGFKNLTADELVHARDHGVTAQYLGTLRALGYSGLSMEEVTSIRDHGVTAEYIRAMAEAGHARLPLKELARARDHGVTAEYVKAMREAGYGALSIDELVSARDHGVTGEFVKGMTSLGPERPTLDELIKARDRGVSPEFVKSWRQLGYPMDLADVARAREHGVTTDFISSLKELGYERLPVDDLIRLRDHGISARFVRDQNASATSRLSVDELVRRRNGRM